MRTISTLCLAFLLLYSPLIVFAQEEAVANTDTSTEEPAAPIQLLPSPDVTISSIFPVSSEKEFVLGDPIEIVIGLHNLGDVAVNVTSAFSSLRYPPDWRYTIQNYTRKSFDFIVNPKEQASFFYSFLPDPMLEPREFGLQVEIDYHDLAGGNWSSVAFNDTIRLVESGESIDAQTLFTYVGLIGVAGLILFIISKSVRKEKRPTRRVETGTKATEVDPEWLEGTNALQHQRAQQRSRSPSPKGSRKKKQ